jgi:FAD/FMN-containing dehydrogenase
MDLKKKAKKTKQINKWLLCIILIAGTASTFIFLNYNKKPFSDPKLINDVSRLNPTYIQRIEKNKEVEGLQQAVKKAQQQNLKISIAGKRHSMGGHTFYKNAVVLDMTSFNKVLKVNSKEKTVTVQSGASWDQVIKAVNPYGLSVPVLQDYSNFTVGGSLSVNVHQSDVNFGPLIQTVKSFRLLQADGTIVNVSRTENPDLFKLVIGGYGLLGVILDVDLQLTDNKIYRKKEYPSTYLDYNRLFDKLRKNKTNEYIYGRLSIAKDDGFLKDMVVTTHQVIQSQDKSLQTLAPDKNIFFKKLFFDYSRKSELGKKIRWYFQENFSDLVHPQIQSRNNLDLNDLSFLDYYSPKDTDILQEYFFPREKLSTFIPKLKDIVLKNNINLLNVTIRYVPYNNESVLSYSNKSKEMFAVVLYMNVGLSRAEQEKVKIWTRELTDDVLAINGTYYLPYQLYASQQQIRAAYPNLDLFFEKKRIYDPEELFTNTFYATYNKSNIN